LRWSVPTADGEAVPSMLSARIEVKDTRPTIQ